mmetsp:Transcript_4227/g.10059  ORF Transcript_4227/g.10059 Transcript_4227/m.10059 type:complete len:348 (-) Transcript_4227:2302-3345(-)
MGVGGTGQGPSARSALLLQTEGGLERIFLGSWLVAAPHEVAVAPGRDPQVLASDLQAMVKGLEGVVDRTEPSAGLGAGLEGHPGLQKVRVLGAGGRLHFPRHAHRVLIQCLGVPLVAETHKISSEPRQGLRQLNRGEEIHFSEQRPVFGLGVLFFIVEQLVQFARRARHPQGFFLFRLLFVLILCCRHNIRVQLRVAAHGVVRGSFILVFQSPHFEGGEVHADKLEKHLLNRVVGDQPAVLLVDPCKNLHNADAISFADFEVLLKFEREFNFINRKLAPQEKPELFSADRSVPIHVKARDERCRFELRHLDAELPIYDLDKLLGVDRPRAILVVLIEKDHDFIEAVC